MNKLLLFVLLLCTHLVQSQTLVQKKGDGWQLMVDGKPFDVKGVTFGYDQDVEKFEYHFKELQFLGVNTIRLWGTNQHIGALLDAAHKYQIKVMVGIWMRHGKPGMEDDDHFDYLKDKEGMEAMYKSALDLVKRYKDHPAVLTWGIGNEVYLNTETDAEKEAYSHLLERICRDIKKLDSQHPITSVEAWIFGVEWWERFVPSIDIYGLNCYGVGANILADELRKKGVDKPYLITEFGVTGEWDIEADKNGIKPEPSDREKYDAIAVGYPKWIKSKASCLGVYIFHYGNGHSFASSWLLTHHQNTIRPQYWAIREAYTGKKPPIPLPEISTFKLPDSTFESNTWVPVTLTLAEPNFQEAVSFYYNQRTGSRKRRDQLTKLEYRGSLKKGFELQLPQENGAIKVYAYASHSNQMAIASTSIMVTDEEAKARKYLVPKKSSPFYVYTDGGASLPYLPTAYMGNYKAMTVDLYHTAQAYQGKSCIKISYTAPNDWYGLGFVDPKNNWGTILGGYEIEQAETFSFWAKASKKNVLATIGFGLIGNDKPYPDTAKKSVEIKLGTKWKKYTIKLKKSDMSCIRSGLVIFSRATGEAQDIYLDQVVFE